MERIRALKELILSAATDLLDIEADHKNGIKNNMEATSNG